MWVPYKCIPDYSAILFSPTLVKTSQISPLLSLTSPLAIWPKQTKQLLYKCSGHMFPKWIKYSGSFYHTSGAYTIKYVFTEMLKNNLTFPKIFKSSFSSKRQLISIVFCVFAFLFIIPSEVPENTVYFSTAFDYSWLVNNEDCFLM